MGLSEVKLGQHLKEFHLYLPAILVIFFSSLPFVSQEMFHEWLDERLGARLGVRFSEMLA